MFLVGLLIESAQEVDRFEILAPTVLIRNPLTLLAGVVQVQHRRDRVHAKSINVILVQPEHRTRHQEAAHFSATVIEDVCFPVGMEALPRVRVFVKMCPVEICQPVTVGREVRRYPVEDHPDPMKPSSAYANKEDSRKAIEYFLKHLERQPDDLEVRWLLNLAYMTTGGYPDKVPARYLISPKVFESSEDVGRFRDVAQEAGLVSFSAAGGVIVDDFENIGRFDVVTSSFYSCGPMHFFHNNGDGTFTEQAAKAGLADQMGGLNSLQTDYNNDGCIDILVLRGGWEIPQRKSLLRNNCDGTFTDVTVASGLGEPTSTQAGVWVDINNDGFLDLFVGNEGQPTQLFLNKGDGTFEDISVSAGVHRTMFTKGVAAGDYDNDGYPDLYVSNLGADNILYHNNHDNTFTEVTQVAGVPGPGRGFATWFFDYDNDGLPDIFATSYFLSLDETARTYLNLPHNATTLKLYKNLGNGKFHDVTSEVGLDKVYMPMGSNFGDIDNDGFLDIFLGTGNPSYATLKPSVLLHNKGGKRFVDVTTSSGTGEWHKGHGVAFADLDNRGDEDIIFRSRRRDGWG